MGKPTITKFGAKEYVEGTTLIINDANMLAEIAGNIESRANVQAFHNNFSMTFFWQKTHEASYTYGNDSVMAAIRLPRRFTVVDAQFIGYASETGGSVQFAGNPTDAGAGNKVNCKLQLFDFKGEQKLIEYPSGTFQKSLSLEIDTGGEMFLMREKPGAGSFEDINLEVSTDDTLAIVCEIPSGAATNFLPMIQATIYCKEEHGK